MISWHVNWVEDEYWIEAEDEVEIAHIVSLLVDGRISVDQSATRANAYLIAAAPEMFSALQALERWWGGEKTPDEWIYPHGTKEMKAMVKAALAKASGS